MIIATTRIERPLARRASRRATRSAGDRDPLLLAARQLVGEAQPVAVQVDLCQRRQRQPPRLAGPDAVQLQRQADVLRCREAGQQVQVLEDVADPAAAQRRQRHPAAGAQRRALHHDLAPGRAVQPAGQVEQGGLARARRSHHRHQLALLDGQRHPAQRMHGGLAAAVDPVHIA